jgi:hypothetical protein
VSIEELGLCFSSVRSQPVPPSGSIAINHRSGCTSDGDRCARDRY